MEATEDVRVVCMLESLGEGREESRVVEQPGSEMQI